MYIQPQFPHVEGIARGLRDDKNGGWLLRAVQVFVDRVRVSSPFLAKYAKDSTLPAFFLLHSSWQVTQVHHVDAWSGYIKIRGL